jgi:heme/copper-type cytochrome/quinol oxidase subunit 1
LPVLTRHAVICGIAYGVLVYIVMNYVVIPLSNAARPKSFNLLWVSCSVIVHMFLIGLPAALFASAAITSSARASDAYDRPRG